MQAKCTVCGKETAGKIKDGELFPRKHDYGENVCRGSFIPILQSPVAVDEDEKAEVERGEFSIQLMNTGGLVVRPDDCGVFATVTHGGTQVGIYLDAIGKKVEFTFAGKITVERRRFTVKQLVELIKKY